MKLNKFENCFLGIVYQGVRLVKNFTCTFFVNCSPNHLTFYSENEEYLKFPNVDEEDDIVQCHRVKSKTHIIAKLKQRQKRHDIMTNRSKLKGKSDYHE